MNLTDKLQQIISQSEEATPGVWSVEDYRADGDWRSTGLIWAKEDPDSFLVGTNVCSVNCDKLHAVSPPEKIAEFEANAAFIASSRVLVPALARALGVAVEALSFYESRDVYVWPDGWRCRKEGGPPQLEDCEEASEVGENALAEIAKILLPEEKV